MLSFTEMRFLVTFPGFHILDIAKRLNQPQIFQQKVFSLVHNNKTNCIVNKYLEQCLVFQVLGDKSFLFFVSEILKIKGCKCNFCFFLFCLSFCLYVALIKVQIKTVDTYFVLSCLFGDFQSTLPSIKKKSFVFKIKFLTASNHFGCEVTDVCVLQSQVPVAESGT